VRQTAQNETRLVETSESVAEYTNQDHRLRSRFLILSIIQRMLNILFLVRYESLKWPTSNNSKLQYCLYVTGIRTAV
jgi:hypothetical protein